jgi:hypothetical protein
MSKPLQTEEDIYCKKRIRRARVAPAHKDDFRKLQELFDTMRVKKQVGGQFLKVERKGVETGRPVKQLVRRNLALLANCSKKRNKVQSGQWSIEGA